MAPRQTRGSAGKPKSKAARRQAAKIETEGEPDYTVYLEKEFTATQQRFLDWTVDKTGVDAAGYKTKLEAFEEGFRLASALRMRFQASPENQEANAAARAKRAAAQEDGDDEETPKPKPKRGRRPKPAPEPEPDDELDDEEPEDAEDAEDEPEPEPEPKPRARRGTRRAASTTTGTAKPAARRGSRARSTKGKSEAAPF